MRHCSALLTALAAAARLVDAAACRESMGGVLVQRCKREALRLDEALEWTVASGGLDAWVREQWGHDGLAQLQGMVAGLARAAGPLETTKATEDAASAPGPEPDLLAPLAKAVLPVAAGGNGDAAEAAEAGMGRVAVGRGRSGSVAPPSLLEEGAAGKAAGQLTRPPAAGAQLDTNLQLELNCGGRYALIQACGASRLGDLRRRVAGALGLDESLRSGMLMTQAGVLRNDETTLEEAGLTHGSILRVYPALNRGMLGCFNRGEATELRTKIASKDEEIANLKQQLEASKALAQEKDVLLRDVTKQLEASKRFPQELVQIPRQLSEQVHPFVSSLCTLWFAPSPGLRAPLHCSELSVP